MSATFTPGPWAARRHDHHITIASAAVDPIARLDEWTAIVGRTCQPSRFQSAANARLITAAPDLYTVLEEAVARNSVVEGPDWWGKVLAALAKARGEQP